MYCAVQTSLFCGDFLFEQEEFSRIESKLRRDPLEREFTGMWSSSLLIYHLFAQESSLICLHNSLALHRSCEVCERLSFLGKGFEALTQIIRVNKRIIDKYLSTGWSSTRRGRPCVIQYFHSSHGHLLERWLKNNNLFPRC